MCFKVIIMIQFGAKIVWLIASNGYHRRTEFFLIISEEIQSGMEISLY